MDPRLQTDGYFWARRDRDSSVLVVLREHGLWFACGVQKPLFIERYELIERIKEP